MTFTNNGLVEFCKKIVKEGNWIYLMGTIGQDLSQSLLNEREKSNPHKWYTTSKVNAIQSLVNTRKTYRCVDCIGMIKCYYWNDYGTGHASGYNASSDWSADYMWNHANEKGTLTSIPELPGVAVWMSGHIGVYIGNGQVIESTPNTKYARYSHGLGGPCITNLSDRKWTGWLKIPFIIYEEPTNITGGIQNEWTGPIILTPNDNVRKGSWIKATDGVRWWFKLTDGRYPKSCFMIDADTNKTYYFNEDGYMTTGWREVDGYWYFFDTDKDNEGVMIKNQCIVSPGDKNVYYLKNDGRMASGEMITIFVPNSGIIS